jgi:hypothetical protein
MPRQPGRVESADLEEIADQVGSSGAFHLGGHFEEGIRRLVVVAAAALEKGDAPLSVSPTHMAGNQF